MSIADRILRTEHELAVVEEEIAFWEANLRAKRAREAADDRRPIPATRPGPPDRPRLTDAANGTGATAYP